MNSSVCSASIVLYHNQPEMLRSVTDSFLAGSSQVELHIVDNSETQELKNCLTELPVRYHFSGANLGYGRGHNKAIAETGRKYHIIANPDVIFDPATITVLAAFMDENPDIGMVCPKIVNPDGTVQFLNKRYPALVDLFIRRFFPKFIMPFFEKRLNLYEMRDKGYDSIYDVEAMSGAFMFCRSSVLKEVGGFDPSYFMYFEDFDLSRKVQKQGYRTVYYPYACVTHLWERAAHKELRMTYIFIQSMLKYFNKWGWKFT